MIAPSLRCLCTGVATLAAENDCNFGHWVSFTRKHPAASLKSGLSEIPAVSA